jgi:hypothetical protein
MILPNPRILEEMSALMAGDEDDIRAAGLMAQAESFARGAMIAIEELAEGGYEDEANSLMAWLSDALEEL